MHWLKILLSILLMAFGIFFFVYGGMDDSPGAQLIGVAAVVGGIIVLVRKAKSDGV